jgi:hypothetical protein
MGLVCASRLLKAIFDSHEILFNTQHHSNSNNIDNPLAHGVLQAKKPLAAAGAVSTMAWSSFDNPTPVEMDLRTVAKDLRSEVSAKTSLERLMVLNLALQDELSAESGLPLFLKEGGLPPVIRLLRGPTTPDTTVFAESVSNAISLQAAKVLNALLSTTRGLTELLSGAKGFIPPLVDALRDASNKVARLAAAHALALLANVQPENRRAIAEAGVIGLLLAFIVDVGDLAASMKETGPA